VDGWDLKIEMEGTLNLPADVDARLDQELVVAMQQSELVLFSRAQDNVSVKTGTAARSISMEPVEVTAGGVTGGIGAGGAGAPYFGVLEFGSGIYSDMPGAPHQPIVIRPVHAKALAWPKSRMGPNVPQRQDYPGGGVGLASAGGAYLRLSGSPRAWLLRGIQQGKWAHADVYDYAKKVVQMGRYPQHPLRRALEESVQEITGVVQAALNRVFGGGGGGQ